MSNSLESSYIYILNISGKIHQNKKVEYNDRNCQDNHQTRGLSSLEEQRFPKISGESTVSLNGLSMVNFTCMAMSSVYNFSIM